MSNPRQRDAVRDDRGRRYGERAFFGGMALAMTITVFVGFAPSYYLRAHFGAAPELTWLQHVHGLVFTAWMVLLMMQAFLILGRRTDLHRSLGLAGVILAVLMMVVGVALALARARQGILGPPGGPPPLVFLTVPLATVIVFPVLFGAAFLFRRRPDAHKRLVLLATVELITAGVARLPGVATAGPAAHFVVTDLFILACVVYDLATTRRVHPATLWGGLFLIASQPLRMLVGGTQAWMVFARWLIG